jgi:hypothetical protein
VAERPTPNWQPITQLPFIGSMLDDMLPYLRVQYANLLEARERPQVLDDATIARAQKAYGEQLEGLWLFEEQLNRWSQLSLRGAQRREIARLQGQPAAMRKVLTDILALVAELSRGTIEAIMAKSDEELGRDIVLGKIRPPKGMDVDAMLHDLLGPEQ